MTDKDVSYRLATLKMDSKKEEICYHFASVRNTRTVVDLTKENFWNKVGIPDHITFHKDGKIHITTKNSSNMARKDLMKLDDNLFYSMGNYGILPLIMESFYFDLPHEETIPEFKSKQQKGEDIIKYTRDTQYNWVTICIFVCKGIPASEGMLTKNPQWEMRLPPPDQKQLEIWWKNLNLHKFSIPNAELRIIEWFNWWWFLPIFSHYVIQRDNSKWIDTKQMRSRSILPPKDIFLKGDFETIFEK
jgi:hypothetical protein